MTHAHSPGPAPATAPAVKLAATFDTRRRPWVGTLEYPSGKLRLRIPGFASSRVTSPDHVARGQSGYASMAPVRGWPRASHIAENDWLLSGREASSKFSQSCP